MPTRGLRGIRGSQIVGTELRDANFDPAFKINEDKVNIAWLSHTETLLAKKVDMFIQVNNKSIAGVGSLDVSADLGARPVATDTATEGVVLSDKVIIRNRATPDSPVADAGGNPVYGKLTEAAGVYTLAFYSAPDGVETAYNGAAGVSIDYKFAVRTNLLNVPIDAFISNGQGFVEGATDAKAYNNILQLTKDLYGAAGHVDNDGNANLVDEGYGASLYERIQTFIAAIANTTANKGASLVGVIVDANYTGATVQAALVDIASRVAAIVAEVTAARGRAATTNGYFPLLAAGTLLARLASTEQLTDTALKNHADRLAALEVGLFDELIVEANGTGTQTIFPLPEPAVKKSVVVHVNGITQAPGLNYDRTLDGNGNVTGITLPAPLTMGAGAVPDVLYVTFTTA